LVISVGGDGTLLEASHVVASAPVLGVNSDLGRSEAVFCAASRHNVDRVLRAALAGRLPERRLARLAVRLDGRIIGPPVLNDVLAAHPDPAAMSRYRLAIGRRKEAQKSSGLWIATAAGSSSAALAAGGVRLPWTTSRFQYRPRELYRGRLTRPVLRGGILSPSATVELTWLMREGRIFIDGSHVHVPLKFGDRVTVSVSARDSLRVLGARGPAV
jgi:NAD+ kinase